MTEEQLLVFLSVDDPVRAQFLQLRSLGAHLQLKVPPGEIVVMGPRLGHPGGGAVELARVPFNPEASPAERRYAARLLVVNANRALLWRRPVLPIAPLDE